MPSTERSEGQAKRPLLRWQPIKNALRLNGLKIRSAGRYGHYIYLDTGMIGLHDWKTAPDPQAFILARIANAAWRRDNAR